MLAQPRSSSVIALLVVLGVSVVLAAQAPQQPTGLQVSLGSGGGGGGGGSDTTNYCAVGCFYVRPNGQTYGNGSGTSWTNAFSGFSAMNSAMGSIPCGSTIWVAGGSYSQGLSLSKACSSGARSAIRRARSDTTAATGAAGWSSSFDSNITQTNQSLSLSNADFWTVSGATSFNGGTWGWIINNPGYTGEDYASTYANTNFARVEYIDFEGPGFVSYTGDSRGISLSNAGNASDITFFHVAVHKFTSGIFISGADNITFDHIDEADCSAVNSASWHPNGIWAAGAANMIVKYSVFHKGPQGHGVGEGIFAEQSGGNTDWQIYGNVFYDLDLSGEKAIEITSSLPNLKIFNNTFDNVLNPLYTQASAASGTEVRNNIFSRTGAQSYGTTSNSFSTTSSGVFMDRTNHDYRLVSTIGSGFARNLGMNLSSFFSLDPDNTTYGSDGTWDVGAYEFH